MNIHDFGSPIVAVDAVVFQLVDDALKVLLIQRASQPFLGSWALPGVCVLANETTYQALGRGLTKETGLSINQVDVFEQPYAFDAPERDPRAYVVAVMYVGLCKNVTPAAQGSSKTIQNPQFLPVLGLPKLAFDHGSMVRFAHQRLQTLATSTAVVGSLMPQYFTLSQLQAAYQAIFCKPLDKRNFRKRIVSLGLIKDTGKVQDGAHRPAKLYTFIRKKPQNLIQMFE